MARESNFFDPPALTRTPQISIYPLGNLISLQAFEDFGKAFNFPGDEVNQTCVSIHAEHEF